MDAPNINIGFIGAGNMAEAIIGAMLKTDSAKSEIIFASDVSEDRIKFLEKKYQIKGTGSNAELFDQCSIIVLSVKPQQMRDVLNEIVTKKDFSIKERKLVISIAAGITIQKLEDILYTQLDEASRAMLPIIRVMPNTPALVLSGMSGMASNENADEFDIATAENILKSMGDVIVFDEASLDAVTAVSGSGPAYVFYFAESMIDAGIKLGLDPKDAVFLATRTFNGAVKLLEETGEAADVLRKKVTSPGGTTEAALKVMEEAQVKDSIIDAVFAAAKRSKELS